MITIIIHGQQAPQGSKKFVGLSKSGRGLLVESSKKVKPWRQDVVAAAVEVREKFAALCPDVTHTKAAEMYGVGWRAISDIRSGQSWRHQAPAASVFSWRPE